MTCLLPWWCGAATPAAVAGQLWRPGWQQLYTLRERAQILIPEIPKIFELVSSVKIRTFPPISDNVSVVDGETILCKLYIV